MTKPANLQLYKYLSPDAAILDPKNRAFLVFERETGVRGLNSATDPDKAGL